MVLKTIRMFFHKKNNSRTIFTFSHLRKLPNKTTRSNNNKKQANHLKASTTLTFYMSYEHFSCTSLHPSCKSTDALSFHQLRILSNKIIMLLILFYYYLVENKTSLWPKTLHKRKESCIHSQPMPMLLTWLYVSPVLQQFCPSTTHSMERPSTLLHKIYHRSQAISQVIARLMFSL